MNSEDPHKISLIDANTVVLIYIYDIVDVNLGVNTLYNFKKAVMSLLSFMVSCFENKNQHF